MDVPRFSSGRTERTRLGIVRRVVLISTMLLVVAATYLGGIRTGLDTLVPQRHWIYGIPVALSKDLYGLDGYVAYDVIAQRFIQAQADEAVFRGVLPRDSNGRFSKDAVGLGEGLFFVPGDDKGDITFTRLAFWLFGLHIKGLYRTYFIVLFGSAIAFMAAFHREPEKLLIGVAVQLATFSLLSAFQSGLMLPHVFTFYDVRIYGAVAALAILHLGFSCIDRHHISLVALCAIVYQVMVIAFAVHVRSTSIVMSVALLAWVATVATLRAVRHARDRQIGRTFARMIGSVRLWPAVALVMGFVALVAWERVMYHPRYFASHMARHLIWHNVGIGFALHPALGKPHHYVISDEAMMKQVGRYLYQKGDRESITRIFGPAYGIPTQTDDDDTVSVGVFFHSPTSDLALYDAVAREVVFETARAHPLQTAALFLYYKPRYILAHILWFTGYLVDQPSVDPTGRQSPLLRAREDTRTRGAHYTVASWTSLAIFVLALIVAWPRRSFGLPLALGAAVILFFFSLLPLVIAYPGPHVIGDPMPWLALTLYLGIAVAWSWMPWQQVVSTVRRAMPR